MRLTKKWDEEAAAKKLAKEEAERAAQTQAPPIGGMQVAEQPVPMQAMGKNAPPTTYGPSYIPMYAAPNPTAPVAPPAQSQHVYANWH